MSGQHDHRSTSEWLWCTEKNGQQSISKSRGGWTTKLHMLCANERIAVAFHLSGGGCHDAPQGRKLLADQGLVYTNISLLMDRAYEGGTTRNLALQLGYGLCVPPKSNRKHPGATIMLSTNEEMRWNASFAVSRLTAGFLLAMINSILFFLPSSFVLLSLMLFDSVNTT